MEKRFLRRYTDLPALFYLIKKKRITLLDPMSWDDKNDSKYIESYKERCNLKTVLALCFTEESETYHHWRVFSGTTSGVCIVFHKTDLLRIFLEEKNIRHGQVIYRKISEIRNNPPEIQELPFLKRHAFRDEKEFRIIYENAESTEKIKEYKIELSCIKRIVLSPWVHKNVYRSVKEVIRNIEYCSELQITRTTLVDNAEWKRIGSSV